MNGCTPIFILMKHYFLLLTLLCLSLSARAHDAEVDGIFYNLDTANRTATVTYKGDYYDSYDHEYSGAVVIPETVTYNGITYSVTTLRRYCFSGCNFILQDNKIKPLSSCTQKELRFGHNIEKMFRGNAYEV